MHIDTIYFIIYSITIHRHVLDTSATINRVFHKNTNNILFVFLYFISLHLLVRYRDIKLSLTHYMEHINSHVYFTELQ